jgi:hypothetical protein
MKGNCLRCNTAFDTKIHSRKFCSTKCRMAEHNEKYRNKFKDEKPGGVFFCWSEYRDKTVIV